MLQTQKAQYALIETEKVLEEQAYLCYGIQMTYAGTVVKVEDLSLHREEVENLVKLCNEKNLSPLHFQDVLEDFLAQ